MQSLLTQLHDPARDAVLKAHKRAVVDLELRNESLQQQLDACTAATLQADRKADQQRQQVCAFCSSPWMPSFFFLSCFTFFTLSVMFVGDLLKASTALHETHVRCESLAAQLATAHRELTAQRDEIVRLEVTYFLLVYFCSFLFSSRRRRGGL